MPPASSDPRVVGRPFRVRRADIRRHSLGPRVYAPPRPDASNVTWVSFAKTAAVSPRNSGTTNRTYRAWRRCAHSTVGQSVPDALDAGAGPAREASDVAAAATWHSASTNAMGASTSATPPRRMSRGPAARVRGRVTQTMDIHTRVDRRPIEGTKVFHRGTIIQSIIREGCSLPLSSLFAKLMSPRNPKFLPEIFESGFPLNFHGTLNPSNRPQKASPDLIVYILRV